MAQHQDVARALGSDIHSFSNFEEIKTNHIQLTLETDFKRKIFFGFVDHVLSVLKDNVSFVQFDAKNIAIADVSLICSSSGETPLSWSLPDHHVVLGHALQVLFPKDKKLSTGDEVRVRVYFSTTPKSGGIQWFEPQQTEGGEHPFVYTQCQAILSRTLLPCMDTPAVKAPYDLSLTVPAPLVAIASGKLTSSSTSGDKTTFSFNQALPIPSYLIALAVGALKKSAIGPRSSVWTEKELLEKAVKEFGEDTEDFIKAGEAIVGIPYVWGVYDLLVLPAAFPYGGMENPNITFVSSSLIAGDRSLIDVVAHEIAHSWSGNLATNSTWKDFWLNEGFTMYIERLILGVVMKSESYRLFQLLLGYKELVRVIENDLKDDQEFTKLRPCLLGVDPDDAFSIVPYEKGCLFLYFLETRVAGGPEGMKLWLNSLYTDFKEKSYTSEAMQKHFENHFTAKGKTEELKKVDWNVWLNGTGLPPFDPSSELTNDLSKVPTELAEKWIEFGKKGSTSSAPSVDFSGFKPAQVMFFFDELLTSPSMPLRKEAVEELERLQHSSQSVNVEIAYRAQLLSLRCGSSEIIPTIDQFLGKVGRGRYVKPLYKALKEFDHDKAVEIYEKHKARYHSVIRNMFDAPLKK